MNEKNGGEKDPKDLLKKAWESQLVIEEDKITELISSIIEGTHLTYKYILINGILGKASYPDINPLALQAGSELVGAYDARSLCHKVLVPFEKEFLGKAIGGSNEPFLNKPARFPELSLKNPVRKGNDRITLEKTIEVLSNIKSDNANDYLIYALSVVRKRKKSLDELHQISITQDINEVDIFNFIKKFLSTSFEGVSSVIVIATIDKLYHLDKDYVARIEAHKVNQSGASSKEIGDIDVYFDDEISYSIEVKDKAFNATDVSHAFDKMIGAGVSKLFIIYGINGYSEKGTQAAIEAKYGQKVLYTICNILTYASIVLSKITIEDKNTFFEKIMETALEINAKEEVKHRIQELVKDLE